VTTTGNDLNRLYYGDNLEVLRTHVKAESVDLVYLDPPFNSNRNYNVIFGKHLRHDNSEAAQIEAFGDTWVWTPATDEQYQDLISGALPNRATDAIIAMRSLLTENDAMAYLVNMAPRLVELHRVLKPTGSLYLHCDPTMSHYLKIIMDSIFGAENFRNEIIWKRTTAHSDHRQGSKHVGRIHDVILFYVKGGDAQTFNPITMPYDEKYVASKYPHTEEGTGRRYGLWDMTGPGGAAKGNPSYEVMGVTRYWRYSKQRMEQFITEGRVIQPRPGAVPRFKRYLDESPGVPLQDVWNDIDPINSQAAERLGYPTQKPLRLLERIVEMSSNPGDVVLDPFCGCGTTIDAAQKLGRKWIGIDVTYIAIDLITKRLKDRYGDALEGTFEVAGIPRDKAAALALFSKSPFDFERWAVSLINGQPNQKQVGDKGIDGVARFPLGDPNKKARQVGQILISVKGGKNIGPQFVRDLLGTVNTQKAEMGVLITMTEPTRGVIDAVNHAGTYTHPANKQTFPKIQVVTVSELLAGKRPDLPLTLLPYVKASRSSATFADEGLF
jgi:DNA modification methylase